MRFQELFPLIVYINLDSRPDRKEEAEKEFQRLGINPVRISAVKGTGTDNPMYNGILGCMQSHLVCLELAKRMQTNVFIFEDDIKFINNFEEIIEEACKELVQREWDMFYLGANILKPFKQVSPHLARLTHGQSTHAYGVNEKFLEGIITLIPKRQIYPLDLFYSNFIIPHKQCYIVAPKMVAVQRDSYSDIEQNYAGYESYLELRYDSNFVLNLDK